MDQKIISKQQQQKKNHPKRSEKIQITSLDIKQLIMQDHVG